MGSALRGGPYTRRAVRRPTSGRRGRGALFRRARSPIPSYLLPDLDPLDRETLGRTNAFRAGGRRPRKRFHDLGPARRRSGRQGGRLGLHVERGGRRRFLGARRVPRRSFRTRIALCRFTGLKRIALGGRGSYLNRDFLRLGGADRGIRIPGFTLANEFRFHLFH